MLRYGSSRMVLQNHVWQNWCGRLWWEVARRTRNKSVRIEEATGTTPDHCPKLQRLNMISWRCDIWMLFMTWMFDCWKNTKLYWMTSAAYASAKQNWRNRVVEKLMMSVICWHQLIDGTRNKMKIQQEWLKTKWRSCRLETRVCHPEPTLLKHSSTSELWNNNDNDDYEEMVMFDFLKIIENGGG